MVWQRAALAWTDDSVRLIHTPSADAVAALYYVQEAGRFRTLPSYFTEREGLHSYLVAFTEAGKGALKYRGTTHSLERGQVFFIDCREYQYYAPQPGEPWEFSWVHLYGSSARQYYEQYDAQGGPVVSAEPGTGIPAVLKRIVALVSERDARNEWLCSKLLVDLLTELVLLTRDAGLTPFPKPAYVERLARSLDERFRERVTLDGLAAEHAVSKYHLAREFKRYTGCSPLEYVIRARITYAKARLRDSHDSVADIAAEAGIPNASHFIALFKHRTGATPLQYRKQWSEL